MSNNNPPQYIPYYQPPPVYQNNPVLQKFQQNDEGFGFSNFRNQSESTQIPSKSYQEYQNERNDNLTFIKHHSDYKLTENHEVPNDYVYWDIIKNFQERNPLIDVFFSKKNLDHLQNLLIQMVNYQSQTKYQISRQNDFELLTIMRSIYIKTPTNPHCRDDEFRNAICQLNKNVLEWAVPRIISNIQQYVGFIKDRESTIQPQSYPQSTSSIGMKITRGFDQFI